MCGFLNYKAKLNGVLAWGLDEGLTNRHRKKKDSLLQNIAQALGICPFEHSNEHSGFIKGGEFFYLAEWLLLFKKNSSSWR
jgi:hypothetical protein